MTPTDTVVSEERLTYADLREANIARQAAWCPDQVPDLSFRGNELAGETGEVCNVIKKLERERLGWRGSRDTVEHLAEELADVVICADLCALSAGIDLKEAVAAKFNTTSEKVGLPHRLTTPSLPPRSGGVVKFARQVLEWASDGIDPDGEDIQRLGVETGLLLKVTYDPDKHDLPEWLKGDVEPGDDYFEFSPALRSTLADPIPEAPADEEVEGTPEAVELRKIARRLDCADDPFAAWEALEVVLNALAFYADDRTYLELEVNEAERLYPGKTVHNMVNRKSLFKFEASAGRAVPLIMSDWGEKAREATTALRSRSTETDKADPATGGEVETLHFTADWLVRGMPVKAPGSNKRGRIASEVTFDGKVYVDYPAGGGAYWPATDLQPWESHRDVLGRLVRDAWVKWARSQPNPKASWLVPYDDLSEADKEADRQIGEALTTAFPPVLTAALRRDEGKGAGTNGR